MQSWAVAVVAEQDPGAVVAQPGPAGLGADVLRISSGLAGGAGAVFGQEQRPGLAAGDQTGQ